MSYWVLLAARVVFFVVVVVVKPFRVVGGEKIKGTVRGGSNGGAVFGDLSAIGMKTS